MHQLGLLHADIRLSEPPSEPGWFDPAQIEQVVINLVKNARETDSPPGDIEVSLETKPGGESNLEVREGGGAVVRMNLPGRAAPNLTLSQSRLTLGR